MDVKSIFNIFTATRGILLFVVYEFSTSASTQASASSNKKENDEEGDMIKGLAFGLGGFFGLVILLCLLWKCCCSHDDSNSCSCCPRNDNPSKKLNEPRGRRRMNEHQAKVSPSPPSSVMSWSTNS